MEYINTIGSIKALAYIGIVWFSLSIGAIGLSIGKKQVSICSWLAFMFSAFYVSLISPSEIFSWIGAVLILAMASAFLIIFFSEDSKVPRFCLPVASIGAVAVLFFPAACICQEVSYIFESEMDKYKSNRAYGFNKRFLYDRLRGKTYTERDHKDYLSTHKEAEGERESHRQLDEAIKSEAKKAELIARYTQVLRDTDNPDERKIIQDYLKTL